MNNRINNILELSNNERYVVLNQAIYQDTNYYLVAKLDNENKVLNEIKICEERMQEGVIGIKLVNDSKILELLTRYLVPQK